MFTSSDEKASSSTSDISSCSTMPTSDKVASSTTSVVVSPSPLKKITSSTTSVTVTPLPSKKIRSQPPDVIVSVGSGDQARKFACYKIALSFASEYLDSMLSTGMKEGELTMIEFPDKDPEEWEKFYNNFISPEKIMKMSFEAKPKINKENVFIMLPWFHELQLLDYVDICDKVIRQKIYCSLDFPSSWQIEKLNDESNESHDSRLKKRKDIFDEKFNALQVAHRYDLKRSKEDLGREIATAMKKSLITDDLFDSTVIESLFRMLPPLKMEESELKMMNEDGCKELWPSFKDIIAPHLSLLSQEIVENDETFPLLVFLFKKIKVEKEKAEKQIKIEKEKAEKQIKIEKEKVESKAEAESQKLHKTILSAKKIVDSLIEKYPSWTYRAFPNTRSLRNVVEDELLNNFGRRKFREVLCQHYESTKEHFNRLGFELMCQNKWVKPRDI